MQILALTRRILLVIGLCSPPSGNDFRVQIAQVFIISFFVINLVMLLSSHVAVGWYHYRSGDISECLNAVTLASAVTSGVISYAFLASQRKKMRSFFNGLQSIFDECKCCHHTCDCLNDFPISPTDKETTSAKLYLDTNAFCEKCMKWTLILQEGVYVVPSLSAVLLASAFYHYRDGHVDLAKLRLPMETRYQRQKYAKRPPAFNSFSR